MRLTICKHSLLYQYVKEMLTLEELLAEVNARAAKRLEAGPRQGRPPKLGLPDGPIPMAVNGKAYHQGPRRKPATLRVMREERVPAA